MRLVNLTRWFTFNGFGNKKRFIGVF